MQKYGNAMEFCTNVIHSSAHDNLSKFEQQADQLLEHSAASGTYHHEAEQAYYAAYSAILQQQKKEGTKDVMVFSSLLMIIKINCYKQSVSKAF